MLYSALHLDKAHITILARVVQSRVDTAPPIGKDNTADLPSAFANCAPFRDIVIAAFVPRFHNIADFLIRGTSDLGNTKAVNGMEMAFILLI